TPRVALSIDDGLDKVERCLADASARGAEIVCFPEAYLPVLRGMDFDVVSFERAEQERVLDAASRLARTYAIATILGTERITDAGRQIASVVFDARGETQGTQTKTQLDPSEEKFYVPGNTRRLFEISGTTFGIAICHEGFRYPETEPRAAPRGAKVVV